MELIRHISLVEYSKIKKERFLIESSGRAPITGDVINFSIGANENHKHRVVKSLTHLGTSTVWIGYEITPFDKQREIFLQKLIELRKEATEMIFEAPEGETYGKRLHSRAINQAMELAENVFILLPGAATSNIEKLSSMLPNIKDGSFQD